MMIGSANAGRAPPFVRAAPAPKTVEFGTKCAATRDTGDTAPPSTQDSWHAERGSFVSSQIYSEPQWPSTAGTLHSSWCSICRRVQHDIRRISAADQVQLASALGMLPLASAAAAAAGARKGGEESGEDAKGFDFNSAKTQLQTRVKEYRDKLFFGETLPPIGAARLSYARFLQLLENRMIKRLTILGDGKCALVELPIDQGGHDFDTQRYNKSDLSQLYVRELPAWQQEMIRFYVDLPGDFWYNSNFKELLHKSLPHRTADGYQKFSWVTRDGQYQLETVVKDTSETSGWISAYASQMLLVAGLIGLRLAVGGLEWLAVKSGKLKPKLSEREKLAEDMGKNVAKAFNVGKSKLSTGVKFEDVQGIDHVKNDIRDILDLLMGAAEFKDIGAHVPRGILLEGPPGTGKTYLAKAMADEAGVPFYSANGGEFVQMFQGVAAARIRSLFKDARKNSPSIVFIDEVDAIGKARNPDGLKDPGASEREQGLLQLLVEMDGFSMDDQVLVIAATNRKDVLDPALLRPGRFDRSIYMGKPSADNRYKILCVHARDKQIPRGNDDQFLRTVAEKAVGYSGAALTNLLNEAAILQVRYAKPEIDMAVIDEALAKVSVGLPSPALPLSRAKRHVATTMAGRAVAAATTRGLPPLQAVSITPYGSVLGRLQFAPQEFGRHGDDFHTLANEPEQGNGMTEQGNFSFCVNLMVPLYMGRATEEVVYGRDYGTLSTSSEVAIAGDLAHWLCAHSRVNPALFGSRLAYNLDGAGPDMVTQYTNPRAMEELCVKLQTHAYHKALVLAHERRPVIEAIAGELISNKDESVTAVRIRELLASTPREAVTDEVLANLPFADVLPAEADADMLVEEKNILRAVGLIKGDVDPGLFFTAEDIKREAAVFKDVSPEWLAQRNSMEKFATDSDAPFPDKPDVREKIISV